MKTPEVGIVMGSESDLGVMETAANMLQQFEVPFELTIVSAHRTPQRLYDYAQTSRKRGLKVIIAGAGGAAHLPGMLAAITTLPVIGVPIKSSNSIDGWDSVLSILQMPAGVPVATVALNNAQNAALLSVQILATHNKDLAQKLDDYKRTLTQKVTESIERVQTNYSFPNHFDER
ncbi:MAG: 5-(carboxyamino)imidazole ribonucleotide mutase [Chitinophagales bacterium]|nr:5-(carboxyamino)imidazole ribonucleotide mutase [Bacteroidota bacterium]MCB9043807.1 5-(carboxyamino)imidazole ribonucleotide mutase [Chitinophagales bacterium]